MFITKISNKDNKTISWNAYNKNNELEKLELTIDEFLDLYNTALEHKNSILMEGDKRRSQIMDTENLDEIKLLLNDWNIKLDYLT